MKKWNAELVNVCSEDGVRIAVMFQNGVIEVYPLKRKATKQDVAELLEIDVVKE